VVKATQSDLRSTPAWTGDNCAFAHAPPLLADMPLNLSDHIDRPPLATSTSLLGWPSKPHCSASDNPAISTANVELTMVANNFSLWSTPLFVACQPR
jgi:hypothetical protein